MFPVTDNMFCFRHQMIQASMAHQTSTLILMTLQQKSVPFYTVTTLIMKAKENYDILVLRLEMHCVQ